MSKSCHIIGVLDNGAAGLGAEALQRIRDADMVIGAARTLALFADDYAAASEQRDLTGALIQVPEWIREALLAGRRVVVLASGDPLCFGIGSFLLKKLGREQCHIHPNVSTAQLACSRLGWPWAEVAVRSVHSRDAGEWHEQAGPGHGLSALLQDCLQHRRLAVFTSPDNTPDRIARMLQQEGLGQFLRLHVAECLLMTGERIHEQLSVADAAAMTFASPNVLLIENHQPTAPLFGLPDEGYAQRKPHKGLITRQEVRAVSLAALGLGRDAVVWDIGAGSGSVGLEAARLCDRGQVYAIEKNEADQAIIRDNRRRLGVANYTLAHGRAPAGLADWPDPDAVFIGGSGGELVELVHLALQRLRAGGRLVLNLVTLENLQTALTALQGLQADGVVDMQLCQLQVNRARPILDMQRLAAENPVWIIRVSKRAGEANGD